MTEVQRPCVVLRSSVCAVKIELHVVTSVFLAKFYRVSFQLPLLLSPAIWHSPVLSGALGL